MQQKPSIFIYNPTCEIAIANGTVSFMPNKTLQQFEHDLDILPLYFATADDYVLVHQIPESSYLEYLQSVGVELPIFKVFDEAINDNAFIDMPKQSLQPWGWSATMHHQLKELKPSCSSSFLHQPNANWQSHHKNFYSRKKALEVLKDLITNNDTLDFITSNQMGKVCVAVEEIELLLEQHQKIVIKTPWSSSGRGLQVLRKNYLNQSIIQWINGSLSEQGYLMVEPLLDKVADFSLQYHINNKGDIQFLGNAYFTTNSNGQYAGNLLGETPAIIRENISAEKMEVLEKQVAIALDNADFTNNYTGFLGVDCLLFNDHDSLKIHPCVEINLRYNMGILGCYLNRYLHHKSKGEFKIYFHPKRAFADFNKEMQQRYPFEIENGKWRKGYLPLVAPTPEKQFGAYVLLI